MNNDIKQQLKDALDGLPDTPDAIADHLESLGIRGEIGRPTRCPIAQYLDQKCDAGEDQYVSVVTRACIGEGGGIRATANLPTAVGDFITSFDAGEYERLRVSPPE